MREKNKSRCVMWEYGKICEKVRTMGEYGRIRGNVGKNWENIVYKGTSMF
jgi:hypothetical protein